MLSGAQETAESRTFWQTPDVAEIPRKPQIGVPPRPDSMLAIPPFARYDVERTDRVAKSWGELFPSTVFVFQGRKKYAPPPWRPPFFLFLGLRFYGLYPSFGTYGVYPFPLLSQANGIHHSFFCSVTSGSGNRPRKEGSRGGGVYSIFPVF